MDEVLAGEADAAAALTEHVEQLRVEQRRLVRQIAAVEGTLAALQRGTPIMAETMFDGFDHTEHEDEVTERWGASAYVASDGWWRGLTDAERQDFATEGRTTAAGFAALHLAGAHASGAEAQALVRRHVAWLARAVGGHPAPEYLRGLADLYVTDDRFARTYDREGVGAAAFVAAALRAHAAPA